MKRIIILIGLLWASFTQAQVLYIENSKLYYVSPQGDTSFLGHNELYDLATQIMSRFELVATQINARPTTTTVNAALALKADINNPTFTGTVPWLTPNGNGSALTGLTKAQVNLANADNTSDADKPVSTATQTALNLKVNTADNLGGWSKVVVSGSNATTTGQALVDITGLVTPTLANSTKYEVDILLDVGTSAVTTGTQYAIQTGGTGTAGVVSALLQGTTTTNAVTQVTLSAPNAASGTFLTTSGTSGTIRIQGFVTTRGSGTATISAQHLKVTSGTSTVRVGSRMLYRLAQ